MKKLLLRQGIKMREEDFGILVFNPINFHIFQINRSARQILELCDGQHSLSNIFSLVNSINGEDLNKSINTFVRTMLSANIVKEVDGDG